MNTQKEKTKLAKMLMKENEIVCKAGALSCAFREHAIDVSFDRERWCVLCADIAMEVEAAKWRNSWRGRLQARLLKMIWRVELSIAVLFGKKISGKGLGIDEDELEMKGLIRYAKPHISSDMMHASRKNKKLRGELEQFHSMFQRLRTASK